MLNKMGKQDSVTSARFLSVTHHDKLPLCSSFFIPFWREETFDLGNLTEKLPNFFIMDLTFMEDPASKPWSNTVMLHCTFVCHWQLFKSHPKPYLILHASFPYNHS
jgi:hypothetical protein